MREVKMALCSRPTDCFTSLIKKLHAEVWHVRPEYRSLPISVMSCTSYKGSDLRWMVARLA